MKKMFAFVSILALLFLMAGCATPLDSAARKGDIAAVKNLLDKGTDVNARNGSALGAAASIGRADVVKLLLDRGADVNAAGGNMGWTALSSAAWHAHTDIVNLLIDRGADINKAIRGLNKGVGTKNAIELLREIKRERVASQSVTHPGPQSLTREDLANIIKSVVEDAKKSENKDIKTASAVQSDIGKPFFSTESKIMGDNDYAIIIGIEGYSSLPKSDYSYDDARLVKDYFKALGVKERNIELLIDEKATLSGIMKSIEAWLPNKLKKGGKVFVYYSGHGSPDPVTGEAFLVPYDGDPNYLGVTGYPLKRLYEKLGRLQASEVIVVLDSCFSGAGGRSVLAKGARPLVMTSQSAVLPQNLVVLSATQGSQISTSSQEKGHGIFTYHFLKAIKNGKKSVSEIYEHIKPYVEDDAKSINVQQSPSINPHLDKLKGRFLLRK